MLLKALRWLMRVVLPTVQEPAVQSRGQSLLAQLDAQAARTPGEPLPVPVDVGELVEITGEPGGGIFVLDEDDVKALIREAVTALGFNPDDLPWEPPPHTQQEREPETPASMRPPEPSPPDATSFRPGEPAAGEPKEAPEDGTESPNGDEQSDDNPDVSTAEPSGEAA